MKIIVEIFSYLKRIFDWLIDGTFYLLSGMAIIITVAYYFGCSTFDPKIVSGLFLIVGIVILIWQMLLDANNYSNSNPKTFSNWIKKLPHFKPRTININVSSSASISVGSNAHIKVSISKKASTEEKLDYLLQQKEEIENHLFKLDDLFNDKIFEYKNRFKGLDEKIEQSELKINQFIAEVTISNYDIRMFSVVITLCGTLIQLFTTY